MGRPSRFSAELKERALHLVEVQTAEHGSQAAALRSVAEKLGCHVETLRGGCGKRSGTPADGRG